jgi:hypothetical protein
MDDWRKSSYSGSNGGQCVEVASAEGVIVRDTTSRDGVTLEFNAEAWSEFAALLRLS